MKHYLAIDIGASSGRHIVGWMGENGEIETEEVYRFPNGVDELNGHLVWDTERLYREVLEGIRRAHAKYPSIESLSIDTWGVDYVLLRGETPVMPVYAYRDSRNEKIIPEVHGIIPFEDLYARTGIEFMNFNSIYSLYADKKDGRLEGVTDFLMIPEYLLYRLSGVKKKEFTNATTTGLVNAKTLEFDDEIFERLGIPNNLIRPLSAPGALIGRFTPEVVEAVGCNMNVVFCATHDTGSAVEAIDMKESLPYVSSGTWSLLGVKTPHALTDEKSCKSNYSNEGGVGYNRYQINITGMWIIQCLRAEFCPDTSYGDIVDMAQNSDYSEIFEVNHPSFLAPKSMKAAIDAFLSAEGKPLPVTPADYFRCGYLSVATGYKTALADLEANTEKTYPAIYIVGGGAKNAFLNDLVEQITGKKVYALPIEATAIGNLRVQMKSN